MNNCTVFMKLACLFYESNCVVLIDGAVISLNTIPLLTLEVTIV